MEVDQNPTRQVIPQPGWPCRRCEHPYSEHREEGTGCSVEFGKAGRVPSTAFGGVCSCSSFVFEPASESEQQPELPPETLDGPAMYAEALGYLRLARGQRAGLDEYFERHCLTRAGVYFAGAQAAALATLVADNGTGDIDEQRWRAALAGEDTLPEVPQA